MLREEDIVRFKNSYDLEGKVIVEEYKSKEC